MCISYAKEILKAESEAILQLIPLLDERFTQAVAWILQCKGRIVVSGMGKSGIIGEKISATLASTGTPSLSLHPAEAIHGDLGRVINEDIVLALSKGGETDELIRLLPLLKKIGARIIAITEKEESTLAQHSNLVLLMGKINEACPLGFAPTASTSAMLALGDALAMCVAKKRNFTKEEFALFHPGGSLGRQLMQVSELMRTGDANPIITPSTTVMDALMAITAARAGAISVINSEQKLVGIFTDGDLRRRLRAGEDLTRLPISKVMTPNPIAITDDTLAVEAVKLLKERQIDEVPVVDKDFHPVGMLDVQDILKWA